MACAGELWLGRSVEPEPLSLTLRDSKGTVCSCQKVIPCAPLYTENNAEEDDDDTSFVGQRSGRVVRPLGSGKTWQHNPVYRTQCSVSMESCIVYFFPTAPSLQSRLWGLPRKNNKSRAREEEVDSSPTPLGLQETIAESLYITRPLVHRILSDHFTFYDHFLNIISVILCQHSQKCLFIPKDVFSPLLMLMIGF